MTVRRTVLASAMVLLAPVLARAEFTSLALDPADGILNPAVAHSEGTLEIRFSAETTGTARLSGSGLPTPVTVDYPTAGATATISLGADALSSINEWLSLELRIATSDEGDDASEPVTTVRVAVDATRPPPPTDVRSYPANQGLVVAWTGGIPDPPPFTTNVEKYILYWATSDLAAALPVSVESDRGTVPNPLPAGVTAVTVPFTDNHLLEGLVNGQSTWVAVEAVDHVGWRSGLAVDDDGRVIAAVGIPIETKHLGELAGIDDRCFVVTAAFGDGRSPWVASYRDFRDGFLRRLPGGESLIASYYAASPAWSAWLVEHPAARRTMRALLVVATPLVWLAAALGPWSGLARVGAVVIVRRRRRGTLPLAAVLLLGLPTPGLAAQAWSLRVSPFFPESAVVDPGVPASYADVYGPYGTWRIDAEYVWSPLEKYIGQLGFGGRAGIAMDEGRALAADPSTGGLTRSAESTRLIFAPLSLLGRWRGQWVEGQPVVPVLSGGLDFVPFQESRETGDDALQNFAWGWHAEAQLELVLDWMDRSAAAYMDENYGITDTFLYGGWQISRIDDFGSPQSYDLSQQGWTVGIRFILR